MKYSLKNIIECLLLISDEPLSSSHITKIISDKDEALIKLPVIIVINVAVLFGLNFNMLNLALPIFLSASAIFDSFHL